MCTAYSCSIQSGLNNRLASHKAIPKHTENRTALLNKMSFGGCDEADRLCHDAAEFEGRPGAAYSSHDAPDTAAAAANLLAAFPLLLLGLIGLLLRAGRRRRGHALGKGLVQGLKPR